MANATITGTASNFGSISGVLAGDAGEVAGSVTGVVTGTLSGSVGVPGPGVPSDGLEGQILAKASDTSYDTEWIDNYATELRIVARNETGATLAKGTVVYINGAAGNKPTLAKALATGDATSAQTLGMVSADILNNQNGEVTVRGLLAGLDTSAFAAGTQLYLSGTTAGAVTSTKPSAPVHLVYVGIVSRQHANQGQVEVAVQNGFELHELHDVKITSVSNGQVLKYDSAQGLWVNGTDVGGVAWGGITGTLSDQTDLNSALNAKLNASSPSAVGDFTITGSFTTLTASSALLKYAHSTNIEYSELTRESFTLFADTADKSVEITNAGIRLYDPAASAAATITFPDNSVQSIAFPGFAGYATESYVTTALGSYLTTLAASSTYLTQANAASTYQTQAGMSSYLTTATASSTYAPLASPALTGTPTAPTAAVDTNTTQVATTAYVIGQGYLKSATASSTYAPLASPALTGTPTAPTAAAATNTTQIATTAFVQQEVPAASTTASGKVELATNAETQTGSSTTLAVTPASNQYGKLSPNYYRISAVALAAGTSGAGASAQATVGGWRSIAPTSATGYGICGFVPAFHQRGASSPSGAFIWSKRFVAQFRYQPRSLGTDSNTVNRVNFGKASNITTGDLATRGVGIKQVAGGVLVLQVHNGTTLTSVNATTSPLINNSYDIRIESDGSGNVTLFVNDTQEATTSAGPTSTGGTNQYYVTVEAENLAGITGTANSCFASEIAFEFSIA